MYVNAVSRDLACANTGASRAAQLTGVLLEVMPASTMASAATLSFC